MMTNAGPSDKNLRPLLGRLSKNVLFSLPIPFSISLFLSILVSLFVWCYLNKVCDMEREAHEV